VTAANQTPCILVTNDDGFDAPGLAALVAAMEALGRVVVVAPEREQSAAAHALTLRRPLRVWETASDRYRVDGTPTDCVHLGVFHLTGKRIPDLVVSGINRGLNLGDDVTYSGTVSGALEAALLEVPAIAFSAATDESGVADYRCAAAFAAPLARRLLREGLPRGVFLNVNVPTGSPTGVRVTRQGTRSYRAAVVERLDPQGRPYFWIAGADTTPGGEPDGDHHAIAEGVVSVTPLHANMTHHPSLPVVAGWALELEAPSARGDLR
jgi:5'-nucleotidase